MILVEGRGERWAAVKRRLRRSRLEVEVAGRGELTPEMHWPGAGELRVAAVVALVGEGSLDIADLVELASTCGDVPVVAVDADGTRGGRRMIESGAEEVVRFETATIERIEHAVHSAVYRRGAEQNGRDAADSLTGLATRAALGVTLPGLLETNGASGVAVLYCDLDRFKAINDELGHLVGDQVLRQAAGRLRSCVRASDLLVRLGGDEFVAVVRARADRTESLAAKVAQRIVDSFEEPFRAGESELSVGVSVGLAVHRRGESSTELLKRADDALYVAKRRGKARVVSYDDDLQAAVEKRQSAAEVLSESMRRDLLDAEVSPVVDPVGSVVVAHLYRAGWGRVAGSGLPVPLRRPESVAAEGGVAPALFRWLLGHVGGDEQAGRLPGAVPRRWIQMPAAALMSHPGRYLEAAARRGVRLDNLVLVVAESDLDEGPVVRSSLLEIARTGARVAIGAFGAAATSLSLLELHPFDSVWVDRQVVDGIAADPVRRAKLAAVATVATALGQHLVIDRPARPEDHVGALELCNARVIDGHIDLSGVRRHTPGRNGRSAAVGGASRPR